MVTEYLIHEMLSQVSKSISAMAPNWTEVPSIENNIYIFLVTHQIGVCDK